MALKFHESSKSGCHKTLEESNFKLPWYLNLKGVMVCLLVRKARSSGVDSYFKLKS